MPHVSGIIVAYNSEDLIVECVEAALASGISSLYVWENSSSGKSIEALTAVQDKRLVVLSDGTNHGFGGGINRVLQEGVEGELLLLINPDCFVTTEVVDCLTSVFTDPMAGVAAPLMKYRNGESGIAGGPFPSLLKEVLAKFQVDRFMPQKLKRRLLGLFRSSQNGMSIADSLIPGHPITVDWVSGFCMMLRVDLMETLRGFDEDYFLYFEDVDICRRARAQGYNVILARNTSALHLESTSTTAAGKSSHYYAGYSVYLRKHGTSRQILMAKSLGLLK
ncbi:glycosyltransferase family 2 protein [Arthrobacter sp. AL12]|uniref:glycosyltransferase family 2 protein n=1 Tax=Arthrobacter sp. AL12 TaxID=3042241 RepID=UPI00249A6247|nr:glycosyltransferase family 2 protein [Arthrobacter sp. AL12]MDI3213091.1 glycosyltransferase family 2 protein [Arthrobacter sp. AL12]